jgi:hypothetical protein
VVNVICTNSWRGGLIEGGILARFVRRLQFGASMRRRIITRHMPGATISPCIPMNGGG